MKIKTLLLPIIFLPALVIMFGCNGNQNSGNDLDLDIIDSGDVPSEHVDKVTKIFYNVPSPIEMATMMQRAGANYDVELLNPVGNIENYTTIASSALNLGIYGADLSYTRMFDQIQESVNYLSVLRKLSDRLGIPQDEGSFAVGRIEENIDNRDSLLQIISETYATADLYLKENDRGSTAALIILGGWVEALYISTNILDSVSPNPEIMNRVAEQKLSLNNLIEILNSYGEDESIGKYLPELLDLQQSFEKITITYKSGHVVTDTVNKKTSIQSETAIEVTYDNIREIRRKVEIIRKEMIT